MYINQVMVDKMTPAERQPISQQPETQIKEILKPIKIEIASATQTAAKNEVNQDIAYVDKRENPQNAGLFDGMGGYGDGDLASNVARLKCRTGLQELPSIAGEEDIQRAMDKILTDANQAVLQEGISAFRIKNKREPHSTADFFSLCGSTATLVHFHTTPDGQRKMTLGWVGDTRAQLLRDGELTYLTTDDNGYKRKLSELPEYANDQEKLDDAAKKNQAEVDEKVGTAEGVALRQHRDYKDPTQSLGTQDIPKEDIQFKPNTRTFDIQPGDRIILSTDGDYENTPPAERKRILTTYQDPHVAAEALTAKAHANSGNPLGKDDDISTVIIDVDAEQSFTSLTEIKEIATRENYDAMLRPGNIIKAERNGKIFDGWTVVGSTRDRETHLPKIVISREFIIDGRPMIIEKPVDRSELENQNPNPKPEYNFKLNTDDIVRVDLGEDEKGILSSIDEDWTIIGYNQSTKNVLLQKGDNRITRNIHELQKVNPPTEIRQIAEATNMGEIEEAIKQFDCIPTPDGNIIPLGFLNSIRRLMEGNRNVLTHFPYLEETVNRIKRNSVQTIQVARPDEKAIAEARRTINEAQAGGSSINLAQTSGQKPKDSGTGFWGGLIKKLRS